MSRWPAGSSVLPTQQESHSGNSANRRRRTGLDQDFEGFGNNKRMVFNLVHESFLQKLHLVETLWHILPVVLIFIVRNNCVPEDT